MDAGGSFPLWCKDLGTIKRHAHSLHAGSCPLKVTEACPQVAGAVGNSRAHTGSQEVGRCQGPFFHQLGGIFKDWGSFHLSLLLSSAMTSGICWTLVWLHTTFSLLGLGKKFPSVLPRKIHRTHRYFPRTLEGEGRTGRLLSEFGAEQTNIPDNPHILWDLSE